MFSVKSEFQNKPILCEIQSSYSTVDDDSSLLERYAMSSAKDTDATAKRRDN
jgi:hypothetical protein